jgi:DNA modification methylase
VSHRSDRTAVAARQAVMTPAYHDGIVSIYRGDARAVLAQMDADSVDCVVTSPPYWGLRDYGTAKWVGGSPDCDHRKAARQSVAKSIAASTLHGGYATVGHSREGFSGHCPRCGAVRVDLQLGLEPTIGDYIASMVEVFEHVRRVLKLDGTLWLNMGDCYASSVKGTSHTRDGAASSADHDDRAFRDKPFSTVGNGLKPKDKVLMPHRLAIALQAAGWFVRQDIVWAKRNPLPESVRDRPTTAHEYVFLLSKSSNYYYDADAIKEPVSGGTHARGTQHVTPKAAAHHGDQLLRPRNNASASVAMWDAVTMRNKRSVWPIATQPYPDAHVATFPEALVTPCILAGCPERGIVLDPFAGSGTTLVVAKRLGRRALGIELSPDYVALAAARVGKDGAKKRLARKRMAA